MDYINKIFQTLKKSHPIRFTKGKKGEFLDFTIEELRGLGYITEIITGGEWITSTRNLVIKPENPKYILMGHYDTPGKNPLTLSTIKKLAGTTGLLKYILMLFSAFLQLVILIVLFFVLFSFLKIKLNIKFPSAINLILWPFLVWFLSLFVSMLIPNKNNANDNTSGVVTLMHLADLIKNDEKLKDSVMFVFTDKEESGLWGSRHVKFYLESNKIDLDNIQIINIDCVGNGNIPVVGYAKSKNSLSDKLKEHLSLSKENTIIRKTTSSDHKSFREFNAINLSMMKKTKLFNQLYLPNIHTNKDKDIDLKNIEWCGDQIVAYIKSEETTLSTK